MELKIDTLSKYMCAVNKVVSTIINMIIITLSIALSQSFIKYIHLIWLTGIALLLIVHYIYFSIVTKSKQVQFKKISLASKAGFVFINFVLISLSCILTSLAMIFFGGFGNF